MQFIQVKDDIIIMVTAVQALNVHKASKQTLQDGKEVDVKAFVSIMLAMNTINIQYDTDEEARTTYEAIKRIISDYQQTIAIKGV